MYNMSLVHLRIKPRQTCQHLHTGNHTKPLTDTSTQSSLDESVDSFSTILTDIMSSFFEVNKANDTVPNSVPSSSSNRPRRVHSSVPHCDKPWFTDELKHKRRAYLTALQIFNNDKCVVNHEQLRSAKKVYKTLESRLKRQFQRVEGDMLDNLRRTNPKAFYRRFLRRRVSCNK